MIKYIVDKDLLKDNLLDLYKESAKLKKVGRVDYLIINALDKLKKHDIHRLKQFDIELEKLLEEFNPDTSKHDFDNLILIANNLNNIVFEEYVKVLNNIKGGKENATYKGF